MNEPLPLPRKDSRRVKIARRELRHATKEYTAGRMTYSRFKWAMEVLFMCERLDRIDAGPIPTPRRESTFVQRGQ